MKYGIDEYCRYIQKSEDFRYCVEPYPFKGHPLRSLAARWNIARWHIGIALTGGIDAAIARYEAEQQAEEDAFEAEQAAIRSEIEADYQQRRQLKQAVADFEDEGGPILTATNWVLREDWEYNYEPEQYAQRKAAEFLSDDVMFRWACGEYQKEESESYTQRMGPLQYGVDENGPYITVEDQRISASLDLHSPVSLIKSAVRYARWQIGWRVAVWHSIGDDPQSYFEQEIFEREYHQELVQMQIEQAQQATWEDEGGPGAVES